MSPAPNPAPDPLRRTPPPSPQSLRPLTPLQPLRWLALGAHDLLRAPTVGLLHGLAMAGFGAVLLLLAHDRFWFLAGAFSGFLVVAPVLAVGLYAVARALENRAPAGTALVWRTWLSWRGTGGRPHDWRLVRFGALLALAGTGWVLTSAALITWLAPQPVRAPVDFLRHVVLAEDPTLFALWLLLGGVLAAPVFASSVITLPLLQDRRIGLLDAVLTSWRVVLANPLPMAVWATLIGLCVMLGFVTALLGLVVLLPVLGYASWHAYRDCVDASALPRRDDDGPP